jgi:D-amino peptidase
MKVYIITDLEGSAGILNWDDYVSPQGRYYEKAKRLVTLEVNAAIEGAMAAGATEFLVVDGHGPGGICQELLHPQAQLLAGRPLSFPFGLDASFSCAMMVGQHAKAGTVDGHLAHTGYQAVADLVLNDISIGELGLNILLASYFLVPTVMVAGDAAACREAEGLVPQIQVAAVKEGISWGAAVHLHPEKARASIQEQAKVAVRRQKEIPCFTLNAPYKRKVEYWGTTAVPQNIREDETEDLLEMLKREY